jgi:hypothetical protein
MKNASLIELELLPSGVYAAGEFAHISPYPYTPKGTSSYPREQRLAYEPETRWALLCQLPHGGRHRFSNFKTPEKALDFYLRYVLRVTESPVKPVKVKRPGIVLQEGS